MYGGLFVQSSDLVLKQALGVNAWEQEYETGMLPIAVLPSDVASISKPMVSKFAIFLLKTFFSMIKTLFR
jgi:hypothetical protein